MKFLVISLLLSLASHSWAIENIEQSVKSSSEHNFLARLFQLDKKTTGGGNKPR